MEQCVYSIILPNVGVCCAVYSNSKRPDGKWWAHWPKCAEVNCPLKHPKLLEGAIFDTKEFGKTLEWIKEKERISI